MRKQMKDLQRQIVNYVKDQFPGPMKYHFTWELVSNVVEEYLLLHYVGGADIERALSYIAEIIPEVSQEELVKVVKGEINGNL